MHKVIKLIIIEKMKSIKLPILGKFLIFLILLASFTYSVKLSLKPEADSKSLKKPEAEAKKDLKIDFKPRTEKAKFDERIQSKLQAKAINETDSSHSNSNSNSNTNTDTNTDTKTNNNTNTKNNTDTNVDIDIIKNNTNTTNTDSNGNSTDNTVPSNNTPAADNSTEKDFYYLPQIGGIKINNPLPENTYGCAKCKNVQGLSNEPQPAIQVTFPQKPGVMFEQVKLVKELSAGGKAALELEEINE